MGHVWQKENNPHWDRGATENRSHEARVVVKNWDTMA